MAATVTATPSVSAAPTVPLDLRTGSLPDVLTVVQRAFGTHLSPGSAVVKRRSMGLATDRGTWVRIQACALDKLYGQVPDGIEAAALVSGVAKPAWYRGLSWVDTLRGVVWRADETEKVTSASVKPGGILTIDPCLPDSWWQSLVASLAALAAFAPTRVATVHTAPITQERITSTIEKVFGTEVNTTIEDWGGVHADFAWANLTAPELSILDWEDFGRGPVGLDQASLWINSLAVPGLTGRIEGAFDSVLATRTGQLCQLFFCAHLLAASVEYAGVLRPPTETAAQKLLSVLR